MKMNTELYTIIIYSENVSGVLTHVTHVFTRRQLNIESLQVTASPADGMHKYIITCWGTEKEMDIITKQIERIVDVFQAQYIKKEGDEATAVEVSKMQRFNFVVEPFQEDVKGTLAWTTLGNLLLRCANQHAKMLGFGYEQVKEKNAAWVLARLRIEMTEMPKTYEEYQINTWLSNYYKQFSTREFSIEKNGRCIGKSFSTWSLIDLTSRKALDLATFNQKLFDQSVVDLSTNQDGFKRIKLSTNPVAKTQKVNYTDLDINGHMNSIQYLAHVFNYLPQEVLQINELKGVEFSFGNEAFWGDELNFYIEKKENEYQVEVRKNALNKEETVVKMYLFFK